MMLRSVASLLLLCGSEALQRAPATKVSMRAPSELQRAGHWAARALTTAAIVATAASSMVGVASASDKRTIGSIDGSGLVFKDKLVIEAFEDPKIEGVTVYISDFERPLTERLQKDFFSDPSQAGLTCVRRATPLKLSTDVNRGPDGDDVVTESKSLLFKALRVKRVIDKESNSAVYVAFSTRINKGDDSNKSRFSSSLCAISLDNADK
ncbi:CreA protein-domain-containing protein [Pelagophyceae sp. CCMP2097]|nr:CreA protein-domain-containing protein [Pelagophyceae sp. CCMP2097]